MAESLNEPTEVRTPVIWRDTTGTGGFPPVGGTRALPGDVFFNAEGAIYRLTDDLQWVSRGDLYREAN